MRLYSHALQAVDLRGQPPGRGRIRQGMLVAPVPGAKMAPTLINVSLGLVHVSAAGADVYRPRSASRLHRAGPRRHPGATRTGARARRSPPPARRRRPHLTSISAGDTSMSVAATLAPVTPSAWPVDSAHAVDPCARSLRRLQRCRVRSARLWVSFMRPRWPYALWPLSHVQGERHLRCLLDCGGLQHGRHARLGRQHPVVGDVQRLAAGPRLADADELPAHHAHVSGAGACLPRRPTPRRGVCRATRCLPLCSRTSTRPGWACSTSSGQAGCSLC